MDVNNNVPGGRPLAVTLILTLPYGAIRVAGNKVWVLDSTF